MNRADVKQLRLVLESWDVRASLQSFLARHNVISRGPLKPMKQERLAKDKKTRAELNEETAQIRREVEERANDRCENCTMPPEEGHPSHPAWFNGFDYAEMDHWLGGSGRRLQMQAAENCWLLHKSCHTARQHAEPSAAYWNRRFARHCKRYGYKFIPHIEHAAVQRPKNPLTEPRSAPR